MNSFMNLFTKNPINLTSKLVNGLYVTPYSEYFFKWSSLEICGDLLEYFKRLEPEVLINDLDKESSYNLITRTISVPYKDDKIFVHELQHALQHFDDRLESLNKNTILLDLVSLYKDQIPLPVLDRVSYHLYWYSFSEIEARKVSGDISNIRLVEYNY